MIENMQIIRYNKKTYETQKNTNGEIYGNLRGRNSCRYGRLEKG